jgi:hypothetical protein
MYCSEYCLEMPDDFPIGELLQFMSTSRHVLLNPDKSLAWIEFAGASNLIGWRFRASSEDWIAYKKSLDTHGDSGGFEEIYFRERALFGMFSTGVSCIESTTYALAALASHPNVLSLPFGETEQRACSPKNLVKSLTPYADASLLVAVLNKLLLSREWSLWVELRNRMTHRSNLPRIINASVGAPPPVSKPLNFAPTSSTPRVEAEISEFDGLHNWLAKSLGDLLIEGRQLATCKIHNV